MPARIDSRQRRAGPRPPIVHQAGLAQVTIAPRPPPHCPGIHAEFLRLRLIPLHQRDARRVLRARLARRCQFLRPRPVTGQHLADMARTPARFGQHCLAGSAEQHPRQLAGGLAPAGRPRQPALPQQVGHPDPRGPAVPVDDDGLSGLQRDDLAHLPVQRQPRPDRDPLRVPHHGHQTRVRPDSGRCRSARSRLDHSKCSR